MQRRGLRLEVDEPTEYQLRNKRWMAQHPVKMALGVALLMAPLGALLAGARDVAWLSVPVGASIGAGIGALTGWATSVESRESVPRGVTLGLYAGVVVLLFGALFAIKFS